MDQNLTFPRNKYFSVVRKPPWNLIMDWYIVCTVILWIIHSGVKSIYEINVTLGGHLRDCVSLFEVKKIRFLQLRTEFFFYFKLTEKTFRPSVAEIPERLQEKYSMRLLPTRFNQNFPIRSVILLSITMHFLLQQNSIIHIFKE